MQVSLIRVLGDAGPFFEHASYEAVNYRGTLNVLAGCRAAQVGRLVDCSSPSTRFQGGGWGGDVTGQSEAEMPYPATFAHEYARTKALGEQAVLAAAAAGGGGDPAAAAAAAADGHRLRCCAVAPHQVYGPTDQLFLPSLLGAASTGRLRVFGRGDIVVSFTHVDNIVVRLPGVRCRRRRCTTAPAAAAAAAAPLLGVCVLAHATPGTGVPRLDSRAAGLIQRCSGPRLLGCPADGCLDGCPDGCLVGRPIDWLTLSDAAWLPA